jgi:hypothetical protein
MRGRPFEKGKSGNPGGRPRVIGDLRELAREYAPEAFKELARLAVKAKSEAVRVVAIRELFDRGYGKPAQRRDAMVSVGPDPLNPDQPRVSVAVSFVDPPDYPEDQ